MQGLDPWTVPGARPRDSRTQGLDPSGTVAGMQGLDPWTRTQGLDPGTIGRRG